MPSTYEDQIAETKGKLEQAFAQALDQMEQDFLDDDFSDELMGAVEEGIWSLDISFSELLEAAVKKENSTLVKKITAKIRDCSEPLLEDHAEKCNQNYISNLKASCSAILQDIVVMTQPDICGGSSEQRHRDISEMTAGAGGMMMGSLLGSLIGIIGAVVAAEVAVTTQTVLFVFTTTVINPAGIVVAVVLGIFSLILGKNLINPSKRLKKKLVEDLTPRFCNDWLDEEHDPGLLFKLWYEHIRLDRESDFERVWRGKNPDGSRVRDVNDKPARALKEQLNKALEKRRKRRIPAKLPKGIAARFERREADLKKDLEDYWYKLPQVAEDAFVLAIVGPTSAGKSTLLNLLLGRQFIQEKASEHTTPCPILLRKGSDARVEAYREGRKTAVLELKAEGAEPVPDMGEAWSGWLEQVMLNRAAMNPDHMKTFWNRLPEEPTLQRIEATYPVEWLPVNLVIADLPGVEGHFDEEGYKKAYELTQLSRMWMTRADAVLFVFGKEQVRLENCYRFIQEFEETQRPLAVFISHMDDLDLLEIGAESPESGREIFREENLMPFLQDNGVQSLTSENVFLGASRFKHNKWGWDDQAKELQRLALEDSLRLGGWLVWLLETAQEPGTRSERQYLADQAIRQDIYDRFARYLAPMVTDGLAKMDLLPPDNVLEVLADREGLHYICGFFDPETDDTELQSIIAHAKRLYGIRDDLVRTGLCMMNAMT